MFENKSGQSTEIFNNKGWLKTSPINDDHKALLAKVGQRSVIDPGGGHDLCKYKDGKFIVLNRQATPSIYDRQGNYLGSINIPIAPRFAFSVGNFNSGNRYMSAVDYNPTTELLAIGSDTWHYVRVYKEVSGEWIEQYTIGNGTSGYWRDTRLGRVQGVLFVGNKIIVSCGRGNYDTTYNYGHVLEFNAGDGSFSRMILNSVSGKTPAEGAGYCRYPGAIRLNPKNNDEFYITLSFGGYSLLKVSISQKKILKIYPALHPRFIGVQIPRYMGIIDNGDNIILGETNGYVLMDLTTSEIKWSKNRLKQEFSSILTNSINSNILEIDKDIFAFISSNRLYFDNDQKHITIQYAPVSFDDSVWEPMGIWGAVGEVNTSNFTTKVKTKDLAKVGDVLVEFRRK